MQNKKRFCLVLCLVALVVVGMLCLSACTKKNTRTSIVFEGIEEIHAPAGTVTEESLLAGVSAKDSKGKSKDVTVDLGGADLSKPGRYIIDYKCGEEVKREAVYIYGDISYYVNDEVITGNTTEITFAEAITSLNFGKVVTATDSFGNTIDVTKLAGSDAFNYEVGEYTAMYSATDKAGQTLEKTITFTVTSDVQMTVQEGVSVKYEQESVTFKVDLDGETGVWLMADGALVSVNDYEITAKGLVLKASYYRTLAPGENALKLCSVNGSTDFTFTVVDTGKPLFTFDSIYKTNILVGSAAVYEMPQSQISGHEYSYTFKVTKDGVSYKAEQIGDSIVFTTSSGKNLPAGIYDVTVTATNKADTSKKTTIKRDFRIYTNYDEITGWQFWHAPQAATMVKVDLSDEGYYRTAWQYDATGMSSWDSRRQWMGAKPGVFQTITFDFYVYSSKSAEKENGPVVKVQGKNDPVDVPFSFGTMYGGGIAVMYYDQNGKVVEREDLKMNTWYTVKMDVASIEKDTDLTFYSGTSNKWQVGMYITEMHFWAYEGAGPQNVYKDSTGTTSIQRYGSKSTFGTTTLDGEKVMLYDVTTKHMPGTDIARSLKITTKKSKEVVSIDFKFLEAPKDVHGNEMEPFMFVHDVDFRNDYVFGANYMIVDAETKQLVETPEIGKWYTLYITTMGRENYLIYPMGKTSTQLTCKLAFKNLTSYDVDKGNIVFKSDFGNVSRVSLYHNAEGEWQYGYMSYSGWEASQPNDPWRRRPLINITGDVSEVRFEFQFIKSDYLDTESTVYVNNLALFASVEGSGEAHPPLTTTILDADFNPVKQEDLKKGQWYTAVITRTDGGNLQPAFNLLPGGSSKGGGVDGKEVNIELEIRNLIAVEAEKIPAFQNEDKTATIQRNGSKSSFEPVEGESGAWRYTVTKEAHVPSSAIQRALKITTKKDVVSIDVKFNGETTDLEGNVINPSLYVHDVDYRSDGVFGAYYVVIDPETNEPCGNMEVGKWYTLYITTMGRENFLIYPLGNITTQLITDISFKNLQGYDVEAPASIYPGSDMANYEQISLYKADEDTWQYGYSSYTSWAPSNNTWNRRAKIYVPDDGSVSEIRFRVKFTTADFYYPEDAENADSPILHSEVPTLMASLESPAHAALTTTIYDENFNPVASADRKVGEWYYVVVTRADGKAFENHFCLLMGGYADGGGKNVVNIDAIIADLVTVGSTSAVSLGDVTMQSAGMADSIAKDGDNVRYNLTKEAAASTIFPSDRAIKVTLNGETRGLLKMEFTVNSAKNAADEDINPWLTVENANGWNSFIVTDTDGIAVKNLEVGKAYTLFITTGSNETFTIYPTGKNGEKNAVDLTFKSATVSELEEKFISLYMPENYANLSLYEDADGKQQYSYQSDYQLKPGNNAWTRRFSLTLDSQNYVSLYFQMRYVESVYGDETRYLLNFNKGTEVSYVTSYYDENFNAVAEKDLQNGVWYNVLITAPDGSPLADNITWNYTVTTANDKDVSVLFQMRDFRGAVAEATSPLELADGNITMQSAGAFETLTKDEATGKVTVKLAAEKAPFSSMDKGIRFILNDTTKEVIAVKFTVASAKTMAGAETGAAVRVDNKAGYDGNYVVIDENGDMCKEVVAGKTYTLFITTPENITQTPNLFGQPAVSNEFVVYLLGKDGPQSGELTIDGIELYDEAGITAGDKTITYQTHMIHNNVAYYLVGDTWNLAFAGNSAMYRNSPTPTNCTAEARCTKFQLPEGNYEALMMKVRFVDADKAGALDIEFASWGQSVTFYQNGAPVPYAERKLGEWYDVVIIKSGGYVESNASYYAQGYTNGDSANYTSVMMQMADFQLLTPDTNEVKVGVRDATNLSMLRKVVNGQNVYVTTTRGVSNPGTGAWQWGTQINVPANTEYFAVTFRIMEAYAEDGVTPLRPSMSAWQTNLTSGTSAWIVETETGKIISLDNGSYADNRSDTHTLELGKWYTIVSTAPSANGRHFLFPCQQYSGKALITMEIAERSYIETQTITVDTPTGYGWPRPFYNTEDGWHYTIHEDGNNYSAWDRRTVFSGVAGMAQVEFEVRINSVSGDATYRLGTTESLREFYDLETGEYLGFNNDVVLEAGKWYKVIAYNGDQGAAMGANFTVYPGDATHNAGSCSVSFRNIVGKEAAEAIISFNLNGAQGTAPEKVTIKNGETYGTLPTLADRTGYTFGGWFKDAACTGTAVAATDTVTGSHTLYAKWEILPDATGLTPKYDVETGTTGVTREFIDGKDTVIFTTEGKTLINTGWQRRLEFVNSDTTKEIVKFRFKYVANNDAEGNAVAPAINYFVNGLNDTNYGHFAITDENGNVVAPTALETGKWYIFYGRTQGYSRIVFYPCNTATQLRTTLYIQDRELLDYEEPIYVQQASHAYRGSTAPYQDAEGNWMIHFRSFTGEHHDNTAEGRQTDIHFNGTYAAATFEFKFNVSQYAASGAELADKIDLASMLNASYFDLDGKAVAIADMKVGQWYRAVMVASAGSTLPAYDRFYIQGYTNGNGGNTVNIDMDMRNFVGLESNDFVVSTPDVYTNPVLAYSKADGWYYYISDAKAVISAWERRTYVSIPTDGALGLSYEVKINSVSGDTKAQIGITSGAMYIYEMDGTLVGYNNGHDLEVGKWYKVTISKGNVDDPNLGTSYEFVYPGAFTNAGDISVSFRNFAAIYDEVTFTTPGNLADPVTSIQNGTVEYAITNTGNNIAGNQRQLNVTMKNAAATQLEFAIKLSNKKGGALYTLANPASTLNVKFYDANGSEVTTLAADTWFKVVVTKKDGTALGDAALLLGTVGGAPSGNMDVVIRNVVVTTP